MGAGTEAIGPMLDAVTHHVLVVEDEADIAFPLVRTNTPGRWLAVTCLRRSPPA